MSTKTDILQIKFTTDGEGRVRASLGGVAQDLGNVNKQADLTAATMGKVGGALAGLVGVGALTAMAKGILDATVNYQRLNAALVTVTGSAGAADMAFGKLKQFAATTPFQLNEVVDAFIKLKARGLDPSEAALRSYGNTAGATGKTLDQVIEAVGDAATGEFERLKEFGVVARTQGDQIQFTFQGVKTTVKKEASEIEGYLRSLGDVQFAGGMERQSQTLGGALSNAGDAVNDLAASIGNSLSPMLIALTRDTTDTVSEMALLARWMGRVAGIEAQQQGGGSSGWMRAIGAQALGLQASLPVLDDIVQSQRDAETAVGAHELALEKLTQEYAALQERAASARAIVNDQSLANAPAITAPAAADLREAEQALMAMGSAIDALTAQHPALQAVDEAFASLGGSGADAANGISDATQKTIDKLREQADTYGLSKSAALEYEKATAMAAQTNDEARAAIGEQYDALIKKVKAEEDASTATRNRVTADKAAAAAAKESAKSQREAADVIARMAEDFDAADEAAAAFEATIEALLNPLGQLTAEYDAQHAALEEQMRLSVGNAAAQAKVAEAMRALEGRYKSSKQAIEAQNKPVEALIDNLEFELRLMKMGNAEREAAIALRGMESEATDEQRAALVGLMQDREVQAAMEDQAHMWGDLIADQVGGIVDALKKGGDGLVDGIADGLRSSLDSAFDDALANFGNELGNLMAGTGSMGSTLAAAGGAVLAAAGSIGASYIGGTSSMGQSVAGGAVAGAAMGAQIGTMIMPGIGTAIGAVIGAIVGAIIGFVAHQDPILEVASNASGINHGKVEGRATSAFGEIYVGKDDLTLQGNMQSQELADKIKDFDNAIASMLTAAEIELGRAALANFDFNQRGHGLSPAEVLAARFEAVVQAVEPAWMNFLDGLGSLEDQVNAFQGLRTMRDQLVVLDELMLSIDGDPFEQMRFAVNNLQKAVDDGQIALDAAILKQNPLEIAEASSQLTQAIMRRYQAEMEMVLKLASALAQVEQQARAFTLDIAQRIAGVGGPQSAVTGVALANLNATRNNVINADDTERALEHLQEFISSVDAWLQSARAEVDVWHAEQTAALNARLTALDDEVAGINAAAQARAQAESQYNAQLQAMQQALLDAERARLQELLSIAQAWVGVLDNAQSLIDELTRGTANPLSGEARMNLVNTELTRLQQQLLTAPESERAGIAEQITQLLNERLALAQTLYDRPSGEYLGIYNNTLAELGRIRDMAVDPAARAAELQAELNGLQAGTTTAVTSFASQSASYSDVEAARLEEIELERRAIEEAQKLLDEEQARRLAAIDDEARAYYEWAQGEGVRLLQQQHDEITAALDLITGGLPVDEYIIDLQERTTAALENIRDNLADFLAMAAATVAGSGGTLPGGGGVRPPGDSGAPIGPGNRPRGTGETGDVVLQFTGDFVGATPADAQVMADAFATQLRAHLPQIARDLKTELRVA